MNYKNTLDYLYTRLPMFQRIGSAAYKADLNNTVAICSLLGNPESKFKSVHIAGTNGKGSCSHMLASILQSAGYKTGLYTSPHLKDFRERIRIDGEMIPERNVTEFVSRHKEEFEKIDLSFFEMTVGLAFDYFANEKVDIAVVEVGLGGRLDSTNVITPEVSLITNISFDHMNLLGDSLTKIAAEKAGIIKKEIPVVIGESQPDSKPVFVRKAREEEAEIIFADEKYQSRKKSFDGTYTTLAIRGGNIEEIESGLNGVYQQKNIPAVLAVVDELKKKGFIISEEAIRSGIKNVVRNTGLLGRWQVLSPKPLVIADTAHNEAGIKMVLQQIAETPHNHLHFVLGMVSDKDISNILSLLPKDARYYFCKAQIPRALGAEDLKKQASEHKLQGEVYGSVKDALEAAKKNASDKDLVFVGGSTFTVAEAVD
jgi:dihydrofolate synthase / folylpolyglutamate synthase